MIAETRAIVRDYLRLIVPSALFWSFLVVSAWSQTQLATLFGIVTDTSGAVLASTRVTVLSSRTGLKRETLTDASGRYHFAGLPTGTYDVRVQKQGFQTQAQESIVLLSASELMLNLSLTVGELPQGVTVHAAPSVIDSTTSTVGGHLGEQSLTELAFSGRDLFNAALLAPGVAPTPNSAPSLLSSGQVGQVSINACVQVGRTFLLTGWMQTIRYSASHQRALPGSFLA
ncbi:MAG TPA: carboxypeptidase-like regulatory domain-containing protein [Bryobacteraceae bacterium]|nr:carboxypeptidase-like regulatory domain-containing protein [Bryobacteraceae bacterium]